MIRRPLKQSAQFEAKTKLLLFIQVSAVTAGVGGRTPVSARAVAVAVSQAQELSLSSVCSRTAARGDNRTAEGGLYGHRFLKNIVNISLQR